MKVALLYILTLILSLLSTYAGASVVKGALPDRSRYENDALFLPHTDAVTFLSFGYRKMLANLLWFNTINYFGRHHARDQNYQWLNHMCELVITLDPQARHVYEFGATMLAWEAQSPEASVRLITRALEHFPNDWHFFYLRGFTSMYFLQDDDSAKKDFVRAAQLPGAHPIVARLAAKKLGSLGDPQTGIEFIEGMLESNTDPSMRTALEARLLDLYYERDLRMIESAMRRFEEMQGAAPKDIRVLIEAGLIPELKADPFGGRYFIDSESGSARSTSARKRLSQKSLRESR